MAQKKIINRQFSAKKRPESIAKSARKPKPLPTGGHTLREGKVEYMEKWDTISAIITFVIPFAVVVSTSINNSMAMIIILAIMLPLETVLNFCLVQKLSVDKWAAATVSVIVGVLLVSGISSYLQAYTSISTSALGIYQHLLAAYPVLYAVFYSRVVEKLSSVVIFAFKNVLYFSSISILVAAIREIVGYGSLNGNTLSVYATIPAASMPFFGFITLGFVLGIAAKLLAVSEKDRDKLFPFLVVNVASKLPINDKAEKQMPNETTITTTQTKEAEQ